MNFYCSTEHAIEMSEVPQINAFVDEVGEEVEVQWGVALDETLGEDVRITIIATGYGISGLPVLDEDRPQEEEAGSEKQGKTIDEAIEENYPTQGKEKEKEPEPQPAPEPEPMRHTDNPLPDTADIIIDFDEDGTVAAPAAPKAPNPEKTERSGLQGWLRRH